MVGSINPERRTRLGCRSTGSGPELVEGSRSVLSQSFDHELTAEGLVAG
jgi:hypothetical protein